jgi:5-methylthioadenosine/S-adenosylhomocysteine deaminase
MLQAGIPVRLGTDGPASNDNQDLWETAKSALMIARISHQDATLLPPEQVLHLALAGKKLTAGEPADVVIVNLDHPGVVPVQDLSSALILGAQGAAVETVVVAGEILLLDGEVKVLDEADLLDQARGAIVSLRKRAGLEA